MHRAAIGVFDSGIGGLTVAAELVRRLPHEDLIYLGDTARLPYGTRSPTTVQRYAQRAAGLLLRYPIKALVIACNTASAYALEALRAESDVPVLGVIEPGARAALAATTSGHIAVVGTEGTVRSGAYQAAIRALRPDVTLHAAPWPVLVTLAEEGWVDHPVSRLTVRTYLEGVVASGADTLVLGCTHFPIFKGLIADVLARDFHDADLALVDSAEAVTTELEASLAAREMAAPERAGRRTFFCTDAPERFVRVGRTFFDGDLTHVTAVDL